MIEIIRTFGILEFEKTYKDVHELIDHARDRLNISSMHYRDSGVLELHYDGTELEHTITVWYKEV